MTYQVRVATTFDRKNKLHRARAYVLETIGSIPGKHDVKHGWSIALDDDRDVAAAEAVQHIRSTYQRDPLAKPFPVEIIDAGKVAKAMLDNHLF